MKYSVIKTRSGGEFKFSDNIFMLSAIEVDDENQCEFSFKLEGSSRLIFSTLVHLMEINKEVRELLQDVTEYYNDNCTSAGNLHLHKK
jgi:hypothetical protein